MSPTYVLRCESCTNDIQDSDDAFFLDEDQIKKCPVCKQDACEMCGVDSEEDGDALIHEDCADDAKKWKEEE